MMRQTLQKRKMKLLNFQEYCLKAYPTIFSSPDSFTYSARNLRDYFFFVSLKDVWNTEAPYGTRIPSEVLTDRNVSFKGGPALDKINAIVDDIMNTIKEYPLSAGDLEINELYEFKVNPFYYSLDQLRMYPDFLESGTGLCIMDEQFKMPVILVSIDGSFQRIQYTEFCIFRKL